MAIINQLLNVNVINSSNSVTFNIILKITNITSHLLSLFVIVKAIEMTVFTWYIFDVFGTALFVQASTLYIIFFFYKLTQTQQAPIPKVIQFKWQNIFITKHYLDISLGHFNQWLGQGRGGGTVAGHWASDPENKGLNPPPAELLGP